jgi:hypothetical protein
MMRRLGSKAFLIIAAVLVAGALPQGVAGQTDPSPGNPPPLSRDDLPPFPEKPFIPPDWAPIPDDLIITIVREDQIAGQFRILDITLNHEIDEETLAALATLLRDSDDMTYLRTYIVYYLPGMTPGSRGWATTHFLPDLEVNFVGPDLPANQAQPL